MEKAIKTCTRSLLRNFAVIIGIGLVCAFTYGNYDNGTTTGYLVMNGGGGHATARDKLIELAGGSQGKVLVVPFAADDPEKQGPIHVKRFTDRGVSADYVAFGRGEADLPENLRKLDGVTGVWFSGGSQSKLRNWLHGTVFLERIKELYRNGGVIGGYSAGAAVMSEIMIPRPPIVTEH